MDVPAGDSPEPGQADRRKEQRLLDAAVGEALPYIAAGLAFFIGWAALGERDLVGTPDAAVFWADVVVFGLYTVLATVLWLRRPLPSHLAHPTALFIAAAATGTALVTLAHQPVGAPVNLLLILFGVGIVFLSLPWLLAAMGLVWVGWLILDLNYPTGPDGFFTLGIATVLALGAHVARTRSHQRVLRAEQEESRRREHAEALAEELERFASVVAHDLQNPVAAIRIKAATLRLKAPPELQAPIADLDRIGDRMGRMIQDLLSYARAGHSIQKREPVDLDDVVEEVRIIFQDRLDEADAVLTGKGLPVLRGDRTQLLQLLLNLVGNAYHYRRDDRPLRVDVHGAAMPGGVVLTVADNGRGFDPGIADRLFLPFERGETDKRGHGIGLATCRRIVEAHGGTIKATAQPGAGTLFTIWLPGKAEPPAPDADGPPRLVAA